MGAHNQAQEWNGEAATILKQLGEQAELQVRQMIVAGRTLHILFMKSAADVQLVENQIVKPLMQTIQTPSIFSSSSFLEWLEANVLPASLTQRTAVMKEMLEGVYIGQVLIILEKETEILLVQANRNLSRSIEQPESEFIARGSRAGFVEDAMINLALIRKQLKSPKLKSRTYILGRETKTNLYLLYMEGVTALELLGEVDKRIIAIDTDSILETGELEEWIEDSNWTPFEQMKNSERADVCVDHLLQGRVVLILDGNPHALIAPTSFDQLFHSPSDYDQRAMVASLKRIFRMLAFIISTNLSAVYIMLVAFHSHLIPIKLIGILEANRGMVPYPPIFEILVMQVILDLILEAILRLPSKLGQIIGVSGAIIVGQTAVSAQLISPAVIIVASITTITGFTQVRLSTNFSFQLIRYANLIIASVFGAFGLLVTWMIWLIHVCSLHPFGQAYFEPMSPLNWRMILDGIFRFPVKVRKRWKQVKQVA